jgi:two-component system OmpR family sensor kinase
VLRQPHRLPGLRWPQRLSALRWPQRLSALRWPQRLSALRWPQRLSALRWPHRPPGLRWPLHRPRIRLPVAWVDVAWAGFSVANLCAIIVFSQWETVPFHFIWISLTLLYGFRVWSIRPTMWVLGVVMVTTFAAIGWDVFHGAQSVDELNEVPLMAAMFWLMVWHAQRRLAADTEREVVSEENARLLTTQRRFLQDASHQLRTPITIALGHAELLASELSDGPEARDIEVVVGELTRLRRLGERLLTIAASEDPDFLRPEPVALDRFILEVFRKWMPTARRRWRLGRLDPVLVNADRERIGIAVDALLENAVRHSAPDDIIELSVIWGRDGTTAHLIVADTGQGIARAELDRIFERFRTGPQSHAGARGTGLGLALVRAVARAHAGDVLVVSTPGEGSQFELVLPVAGPGDVGTSQPGASMLTSDHGIPGGSGSAPAAGPQPARVSLPGGERLEDL